MTVETNDNDVDSLDKPVTVSGTVAGGALTLQHFERVVAPLPTSRPSRMSATMNVASRRSRSLTIST